MSSEIKPDVFVSYNMADEEIATKIAEYLESQKINDRSIRVFFAPWDIKPGDNFIDKINVGLSRAKFFVPILSPDALYAKWPTAEITASLVSDPSGTLGRVIPILVKPCILPPLLAIRTWIDLREKLKFNTEMQKLLCTITNKPLPRGNSFSSAKIVPRSEDSILYEEIKVSGPDKVDEILHSNLFSVIKLPSVIWSAPTVFYKKHEVYQQLGDKISPFILRINHLFTFSNLNEASNKLRLAINTHEIKTINVKEWLSDKDNSRWLIDILTSEVKKFCQNKGLYFDKVGKQFYGDKKIISSAKFSWIPHVRTGKRGLIIPYTKQDKETGKDTTYFYRHRATGLKFLIIGNELFLQINPGWEFTVDGSTLIQGKRKSVLNTRLRSRVRNNAEFDEMRFWAWILSDGTKITMGSNNATIQIDSKPLSFKISYGIYGDHKPIPDEIKEPPPIVEEPDNFESIIADQELDTDIEEISYNDV